MPAPKGGRRVEQDPSLTLDPFTVAGNLHVSRPSGSRACALGAGGAAAVARASTSMSAKIEISLPAAAVETEAAELKANIRQAAAAGRLPSTFVTGPTVSLNRGYLRPWIRAPDVWNSATGRAWEFMLGRWRRLVHRPPSAAT
jgi:hypothetical protein